MIKKIPSLLQMYKKLISISSISSKNLKFDKSNLNIIKVISEWCKNLGFNIEIYKIPNSNNKFNMLATLGSGPGGLLLSGHSDTVNVNSKLWHTDPFELTIKENKIYGLGAVDMKGFFCCILNTISRLNLKKINKPIYILITADEEISMSGAKFFSQHTLIKPDLAIIGEPTSLYPIIGHKGSITKIISILGKSGHASNPNTGINSIDLMQEIITYLFSLRKEIKKYISQENYDIPYSTMNLGYIHGGTSSNSICDFCELHVDIRLLPQFSIQRFNNLLFQKLYKIKKKWNNRIIIHDLHEPILGYSMPSHNTKIINFIKTITKKKPKFVNYCSEASFIHTVAPTILIGPGSIEQAHQPNEFLNLSEIKPTQEIIKKFIHAFCFKPI